jgi:CDP-glycerol glycerophosphotransferase (TagB/SpsB family)
MTSFILELFLKKRDIVVFGAMNGNWYGDNAKYIFQYVSQSDRKFKFIWLTKDVNVYKNLKDQGLPVCYIHSLKGIFYQFTAKVGLYTDSLYDLFISPYFASRKIKLIALRHGRSVKRVRFARLNHKMSEKEYRERMIETKLICYASSTSSFISVIQEKCLKIGKVKHQITGYPRNDLMLEKANDIKGKKLLFGDMKIVLYAPTWRHGRGVTSFFPFISFDFEILNNKLKTLNIVLLLRPHVTELIASKKLRDDLNYFSSYSNIEIASHKKYPDVNNLIPYVDMLLSDYSALYHDYLLLDRPIGLIPYDYDSFNSSNGFLYPYMDLMPGKNISTFNDFIDFFDELVNPELNSEKRKKLRDIIFESIPGSARENTFKLINKLL